MGQVTALGDSQQNGGRKATVLAKLGMQEAAYPWVGYLLSRFFKQT